MKICFIDLETTGLLKPAGDIAVQPEIIEVGLVLVDTSAPTDPQQWGTLVKPLNTKLPEKVTELTGIYPFHLYDKPYFKDIYHTLQGYLDKADCLIAHNALFDVSILKIESERNSLPLSLPDHIICTVDETAAFYGHKLSLPDLWAMAIGTPYQEKHRALSDALDLYEVCKALGIPVGAY